MSEAYELIRQRIVDFYQRNGPVPIFATLLLVAAAYVGATSKSPKGDSTYVIDVTAVQSSSNNFIMTSPDKKPRSIYGTGIISNNITVNSRQSLLEEKVIETPTLISSVQLEGTIIANHKL